MDRPISVSVVIPTVGRPSLVRAIASVLSQEGQFGTVEVIVVNDAGRELVMSDEVLKDPRVTHIATSRRRQRVARNTGAAVARGRYLVFLDDDDWFATGALAALHEALVSDSRVVMACGAAQLVNVAGQPLGCLNLGVSGNCSSQVLSAAAPQFGTAMLDASTFFSIGGMDATLPNGDEVDLFRRMALVGDFVNIPRVVAYVSRGEGWQTSVDYSSSAVESHRTGREHMLDHTGALRRLLQSAKTPYWRARVIKAYAASIAWNLRHQRPLRALSRGIQLVGSMAVALPGVVDRDFWRALADTQVPGTFQRALDDGARAECP